MIINETRWINALAGYNHKGLSILDACQHKIGEKPRCELVALKQLEHLKEKGLIGPTSDANRIYELFGNVRDAEEGSEFTTQIDGVKIAKCDEFGITAGEKELAEALNNSLVKQREAETKHRENISKMQDRIKELEGEARLGQHRHNEVVAGLEEKISLQNGALSEAYLDIQSLNRDIQSLNRKVDTLVNGDNERIAEEKAKSEEILQALVHTVEYVGPSRLLSAEEGWSWFDAVQKYGEPEVLRDLTAMIDSALIGSDGSKSASDCEEGRKEELNKEDVAKPDFDPGSNFMSVSGDIHTFPKHSPGFVVAPGSDFSISEGPTGVPPFGFRILFDGPPGPESGRFVEIEDLRGRSVRVGKWIQLGVNLWALEITP